MSGSIADLLDGDEPALLAWIASCENCQTARVLRIMAEDKEARERVANGESE